VLASATELASPLFERKAQQLEVNVPQRPIMVNGDPMRLGQVFANLLSNAGKYTHTGGRISLVLRQVEDQIWVEVHDDGIGIDADLLPRVFDRFVQGYQAAARAEGGLGLGLTLVRSLVELHGGQVEASTGGPRRGSTFTVRLPLASPPRAPEPDGRPFCLSPARRRILIVDDNEDARVLLAEVLGALGHDVKTAGDASAALGVLEGFQPQLAILDIGLPGMDGYELASRIRETADGQRLRIIALSGYGQAADQAKSRQAGFDFHLVKPVDVPRLLDQIGASPPS
jgi:CheY-like chemotaxis protein